MTKLILTLLGRFAVSTGESELVALPNRKDKALLAWLALNSSRGRENAASLLWGDRPDNRASASLSQALYSIRIGLTQRNCDALVIDRDRISLDPGRVTVDALEFAALAATEDPHSLAKATALYGGPLLDGFTAPTPEFDDWLQAERRHLDGIATTALSKLLIARAADPTSAEYAETARRLLALDPYSEAGARALMLHHAVVGQLGPAVDVYENLESRLAADLGTHPSEETKDLNAQILSRKLGPQPAQGATQIEVSRMSTRNFRVAGAIASLVGAFAIAAVLLTRSDTQLSPPGPALPAKPSIAVLPFDDLSNGADRGYLDDAIAEGIITELSRFPDLFVVARNSSFHYRDTNTDLREISRELGVRYILEGGQQKADDLLRVTVQLIDARNSNHLWAGTYDGDMAEILVFQDRIANSVAATLGEKLVVVAGEEALRRNPAELRAFEFWLAGVRHWREFTREGTTKARDAYLAALGADPSLNQAHAGLAFVYGRAANREWDVPGVKDNLDQAHYHAQKALDMAPKDWGSHNAMGYVLIQKGEVEAASERFREAIRLNQSSAIAIANLAETYLYLERVPEAIVLLQQAMRLDPHHPDWMKWNLAWAQWFVGDCEEGLATMARMGRIPIYGRRTEASLHVCLGQIEQARKTLNKLLEYDPDYSVADLRSSLGHKYRNPENLERWINDLRAAGLPE